MYQFKKKNNKLEITGNVSANYRQVRYMAADPIEKRFSYSGSALPFHSKEQAFCNKKKFWDCKNKK